MGRILDIEENFDQLETRIYERKITAELAEYNSFLERKYGHLLLGEYKKLAQVFKDDPSAENFHALHTLVFRERMTADIDEYTIIRSRETLRFILHCIYHPEIPWGHHL